MTVKKKNLYK